jgi:hydroxymethylglutaryl-CoA reductase
MNNSIFSGFFKKSIPERLKILFQNDIIKEDYYRLLLKNQFLLNPGQADKMIENVVSVFGLPMGLGLNFLVNNKKYLVPMVVEEPSVVAAVSSIAKLVQSAGGFISESSAPLLAGQIQVINVNDPQNACAIILKNKKQILDNANESHPNMLKRSGGAIDLEVKILKTVSQSMVIVHLIVNVQDAMGANLVNSMCEAVAPKIEKLTGGKVLLRILSNLADKSIVKTRCSIPVQFLAKNDIPGEDVRDKIILANDFAMEDPYRAATHNKGIMNGIDPLIIATGNDWRAVEAGAHAYAARDGKYKALTRWFKDSSGNLAGEIELPVRIGTVGGSLQSNPAVSLSYQILGIKSAGELAELCGAVGLAQNLGALRALVTGGIQEGHMTLHARSVALSAGAGEDIFDQVVNKLLESQDIKVRKAEEIIEELSVKKKKKVASPAETFYSGNGKIILLGEHAVVYGSNALAAPIPLAVQARVTEKNNPGIRLNIDEWGVNELLHKEKDSNHLLHKSFFLIMEKLNLAGRNMEIEIFPHIPKAAGLGASAALAVAIIRALSACFKLDLSETQIANLAFQSENIMHGTASGIDNTLAAYGRFMRFKKGDPPIMQNVTVKEPLPVVVGLTGRQGLTSHMVGKIRKAWENNKKRYERIFDEINDLVLQAEEAIATADFLNLGELMNLNHGFLNALGVSCKELEELIEISRENGAVGAKLTGGGGGGAMIALCPENPRKIIQAIKSAGYDGFLTEIK